MANFPSSAPATRTYQTTDHLSDMAAVGHIALHQSHELELVAIANKVGLGAATPSASTVLRGNGSGTSEWAQVVLTTDVTGVLPLANGGAEQFRTGTGTTLVLNDSPSLVGGSWVSPTILTPTIASFTNANHTHINSAGGGVLPSASMGKAIAAHVMKTADQSIADSTVTALAFGTETFDTDTIHDNSTNNSRLTCKTAGLYWIYGDVSWTNTNCRKILQVLFNAEANPRARIDQIDASFTSQHVGVLIDMAVNDYVQLQVYQSSGGAIDVKGSVGDFTHFGMIRMGSST
jgi:hypothetical protein